MFFQSKLQKNVSFNVGEIGCMHCTGRMLWQRVSLFVDKVSLSKTPKEGVVQKKHCIRLEEGVWGNTLLLHTKCKSLISCMHCTGRMLWQQVSLFVDPVSFSMTPLWQKKGWCTEIAVLQKALHWVGRVGCITWGTTGYTLLLHT